MIQKVFYTIPKILWFVFCIVISIVLATVSAYFTFKFYTDGNTGYDIYAMGLMSISLEVVKFVFSLAYPFAKYRNLKNENTILWIMKICFILSILSSMYCLLLGKNLLNSPASKTVELLYDYIPILNIVPLKFSQFISTITLMVLIEYLIIFLPQISILMFTPKDYNRKTYTVSNIDKVKEIIVTIPEILIDRLYSKFMDYANSLKDENIRTDNITLIEEYKKPDLKLLKNNDNKSMLGNSNVDWDKGNANSNPSNEEIRGNDTSILSRQRYKDSNEKLCPGALYRK